MVVIVTGCFDFTRMQPWPISKLRMKFAILALGVVVKGGCDVVAMKRSSELRL